MLADFSLPALSPRSPHPFRPLPPPPKFHPTFTTHPLVLPVLARALSLSPPPPLPPPSISYLLSRTPALGLCSMRSRRPLRSSGRLRECLFRLFYVCMCVYIYGDGTLVRPLAEPLGARLSLREHICFDFQRRRRAARTDRLTHGSEPRRQLTQRSPT